MLCTNLALVLSLALGAPSAALHLESAAVSRAATEDEVDKLLKTIEDRRDRSSPVLFERLAKLRSEKSFKGLKQTVTWLKEPRTLSAAYAAFAKYRGVDELEQDAIEFLSKQALSRRPAEARVVATQTLDRLKAKAELETIANKSKDPGVRWAAIHPLLTTLSFRGDLDALELILKCALPQEQDELEDVEKALGRFDEAEAHALLLATMQSHKAGSSLRVVVLNLFAADRSAEVSEAMVACLSSRSPSVRKRAVELLSDRPEVESARVRLSALVTSKEDDLRLAAIEGLGRLLAEDAEWAERVAGFARSKDVVNRIAAVRALGYQTSAESLALLQSLLADDDWRVRMETIGELAERRDKSSLPLLIERLALERGRLRLDLADTLRSLTGLDHGLSAERWSRWWEGEGAGFTLPSSVASLSEALKREQRRQENPTIATFYDLPVFSDHVAFVLDTSGSMRWPALDFRTAAAGGVPKQQSRMEAAKEELVNLLGRMPDGAHCNLIFFDDKLRSWKKKLTELTPKSREDALEFVAGQAADGQTMLYDALLEALEEEQIDTIYLLSDGVPSQGKLVDAREIREEVARINALNRVRIHCVDLDSLSLGGIGGSGKRPQLLRWLAEDSGGVYHAPGEPQPPEGPPGGR